MGMVKRTWKVAVLLAVGAAGAGTALAVASVPGGDVALTLQLGRDKFESRLAVVAAGRKDLVEKLRQHLEGRHNPNALFRGQA